MQTITRTNGRIYTTKEDRNRFFYPKECLKVFDLLKPKQRHTAVFLLNTGARINEARHVKVEDVDFVNRRMVLRVTKTKAVKGEKKGRIRTIPLSKQFTSYLKRYASEANLASTDTFRMLSTPGMDIGLKKACEKAGLQNPRDFSAHNLRKTLETWLMALGVGDIALTAHIGHDIRTAASHYVSPDVFSWEEKQIIRDIIGDLYTSYENRR